MWTVRMENEMKNFDKEEVAMAWFDYLCALHDGEGKVVELYHNMATEEGPVWAALT